MWVVVARKVVPVLDNRWCMTGSGRMQVDVPMSGRPGVDHRKARRGSELLQMLCTNTSTIS